MRGIQPSLPSEQLGRLADQATHPARIGSRGLTGVGACSRAEHRAQHALKLGRDFRCEVFNNNLFRLLGLVWTQPNLLLQ